MSTFEKRHCCCCIVLSDGVILVGIYGTSFHLSLLVLQLAYGHTLTPATPLDPHADSVVHPVLVVIHSIGVIVNVMLGKNILFYRIYFLYFATILQVVFQRFLIVS